MAPPPPSDPPPLTGELRLIPFYSDPLSDQAAVAFGDLVTRHKSDAILVLKRNPTGLAGVESALSEAVDGVTRPSVYSLTGHARRVLEDSPDTLRVLDTTQRGLLLAAFVEDYEWETPFLEQASRLDSFSTDVGRFVTEATWQGRDIETDDPVLGELATFTDEFHQWLADHELLDPTAAPTAVIDHLADPNHRQRVQESFDAVLVLEFEEFAAIDRTYLAHLSDGIELVCLAERDSAIQRPWNEGGRIESYVPSLERARVDAPEPQTGPSALASFLATSEQPTSADAGDITVIESETFDDQIGAIADEIERLRRTEGLGYDEFAVVLPDSNAPIARTLRLLQNAGIPVASATVSGLEHDPAARELYAVVSWCARDGAASDAIGWDPERAVSALDARVPKFNEGLLETIADRGSTDGLEAAIYHWCLETNLKGRIAERESPLDAVSQFDHVRTVLSVASFLDASPLVEATWTRFCAGLERQIQRADTDKVTTAVELPTEGVIVDAVRVLKNEPRDVVFLVNVVDRDYPAEPRINALFPAPYLETLPGFPTYTTPDHDDVRETFGDAASVRGRPLRAYHAALSRRLLAVGARTARERLYLATYREEASGTGSNLQPSRFLAAAEAALGPFDRLERDGIHTFGSAVDFALACVEETLDDVRRAGTVGEPVDLEAVREDFATVQAVLEHDVPSELPEAIRARVDFAKGAVRRE